MDRLDPILHKGGVPRSFAEALRQLIADRERSLTVPNLHPLRRTMLVDELARYRTLLAEEERRIPQGDAA